MKRVILSWSSGKDSTWALGVLQRDPEVELIGLLTTVNKTHERVAMHAVRSQLLRAQAESIGLPLHVIDLPHPCTNEQYESIMQGALDACVGAGATHMAFGDLYLEDIRAYRESNLKGTALEPLFPIWQLPTDELARNLARPVSEGGVEAYLTCVDPTQVPASFAGRAYDAELLADIAALPVGDKGPVDPCGENGEFHTFVVNAPMFAQRLDVRAGEVIERDGFVFADFEWEQSALGTKMPPRD